MSFSSSARRNKWAVGRETAASFFSNMSCKYEATEVAYIYFPEEDREVETRNVWRFGWSRDRQAWVASNGKKGWRFKDLGALVEFREAMSRWNWQVTRV